ncbi:MAG TPA: YicC family protein [Bacteroidales bacterium]|nr:YicC family protein [Bacteroidales bacterium]MDD4235229.1 YicC family protein [Bacteroidales bacterium]MDY0159801.1 YicC/YloC family endoribonuclease [Bacteroidales bacterium]HRW20829.1 YicC family protein [Bacteroidales bacterium]
MLYSMTGFGRHTFSYKNKNFTIDVKSLNSKQVDISVRIPSYYKEKEMEIRTLIQEQLVRGKIELYILVEHEGCENITQLNKDAIANYYNQIEEIREQLNIPQSDVLSTIIRLPDVINSVNEKLEKDEWEQVKNGIKEALKNCNNHRLAEGSNMETDLIKCNERIIKNLYLLSKYESERIAIVKERISNNMKEHLSDESKLDNGRLEQEMIYYIEKMDINEEKVRLQKHCAYFIETLKNENQSGKKLGFISQEMGREINTLGSKSYHAEMQRIVVEMKDNLEKIKEQVLNIL